MEMNTLTNIVIKTEPPRCIEIDCAPGGTRPNELLIGVLHGLHPSPETLPPTSTQFGCWTWEFADINATTWQTWLPTIRERIRTLYSKGVIRYGSWS